MRKCLSVFFFFFFFFFVIIKKCKCYKQACFWLYMINPFWKARLTFDSWSQRQSNNLYYFKKNCLKRSRQGYQFKSKTLSILVRMIWIPNIMVPRFVVKNFIFGLLNCLLLSFLQRMTRMDMDWPWTLNRFLSLYYLIF